MERIEQMIADLRCDVKVLHEDLKSMKEEMNKEILSLFKNGPITRLDKRVTAVETRNKLLAFILGPLVGILWGIVLAKMTSP